VAGNNEPNKKNKTPIVKRSDTSKIKEQQKPSYNSVTSQNGIALLQSPEPAIFGLPRPSAENVLV
jgi:hypothetical protein